MARKIPLKSRAPSGIVAVSPGKQSEKTVEVIEEIIQDPGTGGASSGVSLVGVEEIIRVNSRPANGTIIVDNGWLGVSDGDEGYPADGSFLEWRVAPEIVGEERNYFNLTFPDTYATGTEKVLEYSVTFPLNAGVEGIYGYTTGYRLRTISGLRYRVYFTTTESSSDIEDYVCVKEFVADTTGVVEFPIPMQKLTGHVKFRVRVMSDVLGASFSISRTKRDLDLGGAYEYYSNEVGVNSIRISHDGDAAALTSLTTGDLFGDFARITAHYHGGDYSAFSYVPNYPGVEGNAFGSLDVLTFTAVTPVSMTLYTEDKGSTSLVPLPADLIVQRATFSRDYELLGRR